MSRLKTFRVRFCVRDFYVIDLEACGTLSALAKAQDLYERHGEEPFEFDIGEGGADEWDVEEVAS